MEREAVFGLFKILTPLIIKHFKTILKLLPPPTGFSRQFLAFLVWLEENLGLNRAMALFLVCFLVFSLLGHWLYSSQVLASFNGDNLAILEKSTNIDLSTNPHFEKTAVIYTDILDADGSRQEILDETNNQPEDFSGYFWVVDETNLMNSLGIKEGGQNVSLNRNQLMTYVVQPGDTPSKIASHFGISVDTLLWANNLKRQSLIRPGQELIILPVSGIRYEVKKGDTLSSLAKTYGVEITKITELNDLNPSKPLKIGMILIIPTNKPMIAINNSNNSSQPANFVADEKATTSDNYFIFPTTGWNWGKIHGNNAVDIANSCGTPIYAAASGLVIEAKNNGQYNGGYGNFIKIQHPNGVVTVYAHLSEVMVKEGQSVDQGALIGRMGRTGEATGCHLHFEVRGAKNPLAK